MENLPEGDETEGDGDILEKVAAMNKFSERRSNSMENLGKVAAMNKFLCSERRSSSLDGLEKVAAMNQMDAAMGRMNLENQDAPFRNTRSFGGMLDQ